MLPSRFKAASPAAFFALVEGIKAQSGPDRQETCKMALAVQLQSRGIWGRTRGKQGMDGEHGDVPNNGGQWCCV